MLNRTETPYLKILDNALDNIQQQRLADCLRHSYWRLDWPVTSTPFSRPCWHFFIAGTNRNACESCEDELSNHEQWSFLAEIWKNLKEIHLDNSKLVGVYANGQTHGQDSPIHRDNTAGLPGHTAVLFCNEIWATSWGGELVLFNDDKNDVIASILPKPGRVVIFNGHTPHRARSPSIDCDQLRTTIAFKTIDMDFTQ